MCQCNSRMVWDALRVYGPNYHWRFFWRLSLSITYAKPPIAAITWTDRQWSRHERWTNCWVPLHMHGDINSSSSSPSHSRQIRQQAIAPASKSSFLTLLDTSGNGGELTARWFSSRGSESLGFSKPDGSVSCNSPSISRLFIHRKSS